LFGWPSVFYVNIPFVLVGFVLCLLSVKESRSEVKMDLDYFGIFFLVVTISSLVFAVVEATSYGWSSSIIITAFIISFISSILLIITESKVPHPIMAGELFKNRVFMPSMLFSFAGGAIMSIILFINPLYLHLILNKSIWITGVILFIIPLTVVVSSPIFGHINQRVGCKTLLICGGVFYILTALGHLWFSITLNYYLLVPVFILFGLGWAIVNQVPAVALGQSIHGDHLSVAMGALFTFFNIGASVMLAVSVSLFHWKALQALSQGFLNQHIQLNPAQQSLLAQFVNKPDTMQQVIQQLKMGNSMPADIFQNSFISGMHVMFWPLLVFSILALIAVMCFMNQGEK